MERNRRETICAGLIASSIVTVHCTDQECVCALGPDSEDPDGELFAEEDNELAALAEDLPPMDSSPTTGFR